MRQLRFITTGILLAFVAASVGYLLGQQAGFWPSPGAGEARDPARRGWSPAALAERPDAPGAAPLPDRAVVYYFHSRERCHTCFQTEAMTRDLLRQDFAGDLAAGRVEWRPLVLEESAALAKRYDAASSAVVVASIRDGNEVGFVRLDDLWKVLDEGARFDARVGEAVRRAMAPPSETHLPAAAVRPDGPPRGGDS